ncbi:MAG: YggS family pyridoxal phosphate-dependent enzyme [Flavobacteriaceae bacterium]|nr:YggS family pyridoxal phosphate-dependent enzyme [Flavobacteriaceae bacterium]
MNHIAQNISVIKNRIIEACKKSGRNPDEVKLLLATKTVEAEGIKKAFEAGETLMGENKVQELKSKYEELKSVPHTKHLIGHLQTNKIKDVLKCDVACIQSLDRWDLAEKLQQRLEYEGKTIDVLIQVNTSYEESKFGLAPKEVVDFVKKVSTLDRLKIKGLMTIGLFSAEEEKVRKCFQLLKSIQQEIMDKNIPNVEMKELSMGMSGDLEIAIEEGSTMIRVGTAIFGERIYPDSHYWNENSPKG